MSAGTERLLRTLPEPICPADVAVALGLPLHEGRALLRALACAGAVRRLPAEVDRAETYRWSRARPVETPKARTAAWGLA